MAGLTLGEKVNVFFLKTLSKLVLNYKQNIKPSELRKGLIFCQMGIGNCVLFLPVINNLLQKRDDFELVILTNSKANQEILRDQFREARIIKMNFGKYSFLKKVKFYIKMRKEKFDFSIMNFLGQKKENIHLNIYCQIPYRIGNRVKEAGGRGKYDFIYNYSTTILNKHEIDFNLDLIKPLLPNEEIIREPSFAINGHACQKARNFLSGLQNKKKIVLQVYSSFGIQKNWYGRYYVDLISRIKEKYDAAIILLGSSNEKDKIDSIFKDVDFDYYNVAGKFSIQETAAIIKFSDLFIGNDSGLGHISAALGQYTFIIIGMTDPNRIRPIGKRIKIFYKELSCSPCDAIGKYPLYKNCPYDYKCMQKITPKQIYRILTEQKVLDHNKN